MKNQSKYILCVVLLAISMFGYSQFAFGAKVGTNFTNFVDKTSMDTGFDVAIFLRFGTKFYFQPEVKYSFSKSSFNHSDNQSKDMEKIKNNYFNIPLFLGYKFVNL